MVACAETLTAERKGKNLCARYEFYLESRGYRYDAETENYYVRNRYYSPSLGRWMEQDPAQYINGANTYQFVNSSPVGNVDAEGLVFLGERRIVGDTFALRPALRHSSPGLIHTEQRALSDMGAITAIAGLPEALNDLSEGAIASEAWETALLSNNSEAMDEATTEWDSWLTKYVSNQTFDAMQKSVRGLIKSDLKGYGNAAALTQGWAVWVRVTYQQYQELETRTARTLYLFACPTPRWVTHHQWVKVDPGDIGLKATTFRTGFAIAWDMPWIYLYANQQVLRGGFRPPPGAAQ